MAINNNMTVGEMATLEPKSIELFKESGIDFCCEGGCNLMEALKKKDITPVAFEEKLEVLKQDSKVGDEPDFASMGSSALVDYIVEKHHRYMQKKLPETNALFLKVLGVHGAHHPELYEIYRLFGAFMADLEQHMVREESIFFPAIKAGNREEIKSMIGLIKEEHEAVGRVMDKAYELSNKYTVPEDACRSFNNLYVTLNELTDDTHIHVHIENNILFKKFDV